ncbi:Myb/SANT-like domain containing protein [Trema orientale]|uniref:Myb/SANT-like domain containing protein n=1 Tax=Trema orientale TaxID=63057 RepID=A0A2P5FK92_TREOI|nr:Myb/SANT-like domain containing protein [Trema orientale]
MANGVTELDDACLWGPTVEKILIDIMVDEVNTGNMRNGQFSSNIWSKILEKLQSKSKRMFSMKQVKQKYNRLRTKYQLIFNKSTATGSFHRAAGEGLPNTDDERELEGEFGQKDTRNNDDHDSTSCTGARLVDKAAKVKTDACLAKAEKYKKSPSAEGNSQKEEFSLTKCVQIIEGIEGIDDDVYMKAVEKFKDPDWREIFVNMSTLRKRAWLDRL